MIVAVVLGNRLNNDGSGTDIMHARMQLTLDAHQKFAFDKIILSGGPANKLVGKTEAQYMRDYLIAKGLPGDLLVCEGNSMTTKQNAEFSVPMALELGATEIVVITSAEHMHRTFFRPLNLFSAQLKKHREVKLLGYCGK